jgi:membrane protease YdiL (CAAX protease family)
MEATRHDPDSRELLLLALLLACYFALLLPTEGRDGGGALWFRLLAPNLCLLVGSAVLIRRRAPQVSLTRGGRCPASVAVAGGLCAAGAVLGAAALVTRFVPLGEGAPGAVTPPEGLVLMTLVPIAEELYFRGLLLDHLRRSAGAAMAVLLTSGLFALLHLPYDQHIPMAGLSVALCVVTLLTRSLLWAVLIHAAWNAKAVILSSEARTVPVVAVAAVVLVAILTARGVATRWRGERSEHG